MQKEIIKYSVIGFPHKVKPIENVFRTECDVESLDTDVLQCFSGLQNKLIEGMVNGACAITQMRKSEEIEVEDLLCHLDTQWEMDPLILTETSYKVAETTKKNDFSLPAKPLPRQKTRPCNITQKTKPKVEKITAKRKKELKREADQRTFDICRFVLFKTPLPQWNKKLEAEGQPSVNRSRPDKTVSFGKKSKKKMYGISDSTPIAPTESCSQLTKKTPKKSVSEFSDDEQFSISSRPDLIDFFGKKHRQHIYSHTPSPMTSTNNFNPNVDETSICKSLIKDIPSAERVSEIKVPKPHSDVFTNKMHGINQNVFVTNTASELFHKISTCKHKPKVEREMLTYGIEKTAPKLKLAKQSSIQTLHSSDLLFSKVSGTKLNQEVSDIETILKQSSEVSIGKLKSKAEEKTSTCKRTIKILSSLDKKEPGFNTIVQPSVGVLSPDPQFFKIPRNKMLRVSGFQSMPMEISKVESQPSNKMGDPNLRVPKIPCKNRKQKVFDVNDAPIKAPEATRKKLAATLLRLTGKY